MSLNNRQLRHLRGRCHALKPVVTVSGKGLSDTVRAEIDSALEHHELVKIKLKADRDTRGEWAAQIVELFGASTVLTIGQVACFYRRNPDKPVIELPK